MKISFKIWNLAGVAPPISSIKITIGSDTRYKCSDKSMEARNPATYHYRLTNQPTKQPTDKRTDRVIEKFHFQ